MSKKEAESAGGSDGNSLQNTTQITDISLNAAIKRVVDMTNRTLAIFEQTTEETSTAFASRLTSFARQARYVATRGISIYEQRGNYGPQIVGGAAVVVGGAVALRRGRFPGALAGGVSAAAAYGTVYGYEDYYNTAKSLRDYMPKN